MKVNLQNLASQVSGAGANSRIQLGETENAIKTTNFFGRLWNAVTRTSSEKAQNQETINQVLKSIEENGGSLSQETRDYMEGLATQGKPLSARRFNALMEEANIDPLRPEDPDDDSVDADDDDYMTSQLNILKSGSLFGGMPQERFKDILQRIVDKSSSEGAADLGRYELTWNGESLTGSSEEKKAKFQGKLSEYAETPERGGPITQFFSDNTLRDLSHLMKEANITSKWDIKTSPDSKYLKITSVPHEGEFMVKGKVVNEIRNGFSFEYMPSQVPGGAGKVLNPSIKLWASR